MSKETKEYDAVLANVRAMLKTTQGCAFIWEILGMCQIYSSTPGKFAAGQRDIGIKIMDLLDQANPTAYARLLLNHNEKQK